MNLIVAGAACSLPRAKQWLTGMVGSALLTSSLALAQNSPTTNTTDPLQLYVVTHTHSDFAWADSMAGCLDKNVAAIAKSVELAEKYPDFRFCMEHMLAVREYLKRNPEKLGVLQQLMREGRIEAGGFYTGPWELTGSAEGLVRQLYWGKRWVQQTLNIDPVTVWNVDVAGHTAQLPQILHKAGVKGFVISAGSHGPDIFNWHSRDGSSVPTWTTPWGYACSFELGLREKDLRKVTEKMPQFVAATRRNSTEFHLPPVGFIADGMDIRAPSEQVMENLRRWNNEHRQPAMTYSSTAKLFASIEHASLPEVVGEMPSPWDTVQAQGNECFMPDRQLDGRYLATEKLAAFCSVAVPAFAYPQSEFDAAWEKRLYMLDHNWGGWHGAENDQLKAELVQQAARITDTVLGRTFSNLTSAIRFKSPVKGAMPVVVFNPLSWDRKDVVTCEVPAGSGAAALRIVDNRGRTVPFQVTGTNAASQTLQVVFCAEAPSVGYTTYYASWGGKAAAARAGWKTEAGNNTFENAYFKLQLDPATGGIKSLYDKHAGRELVRPGSKFACNELVALEDDDVDIGWHLTGKQWRASANPSTIRVVEQGPVRLVIEISGRLFEASQRVQQIILYSELPRIDLVTKLDWEGKRNVQVYQEFPLNVSDPTVRYAVPYGWEQYGSEMKYAAPWFEKEQRPVAKHDSRGVRGWIELSSGSDSITLASQCNYAAFKDLSSNPQPGFLIQPLLLRTVRSCGDDGKLYYEQKGHHEFRFALQAQADSTHLGEELDSPLMSYVPAGTSSRKAGLPDRLSFLSVKDPNVHVAVAKRAEDGKGLIVRLVEMKERTKSTHTVLRTFRPVASATQTSVIEYDQGTIKAGKDGVPVTLAPSGIETIRLGLP